MAGYYGYYGNKYTLVYTYSAEKGTYQFRRIWSFKIKKNLSLPASTWTHKVKHEGLWVHTPYISIPHDPFWIMTHSESLQFESDRTVARSTPAFLMLSWNRSFLFCSSCGPKWVIFLWRQVSNFSAWGAGWAWHHLPPANHSVPVHGPVDHPMYTGTTIPSSDWNVNMAPIPPENVHSRIMKNGKWKQHQQIQGFIQQ